MSEAFTHLKEEYLSNHEWAKEVRARLNDLNELLQEAVSRDIIISGTVAMSAGFYCDGDNHLKPCPTVRLLLSERI